MIPGAFTYLHCKRCLTQRAGKKERLEIGITPDGLAVSCRAHGPVGTISPEKLTEMMSSPPQCDHPDCDCGAGTKH